MKDASKSLEDLKAKRIAARQNAPRCRPRTAQPEQDAGIAVRTGRPPGSFSRMKKSRDRMRSRHRRLLEAKIAQDCNYDPEKFRQHVRELNFNDR